MEALSSAWTHDSSPLPSPGPPPSPAVWAPHDWTPVARKNVAPSRSLPLIPSAHEGHPAYPFRTNTTFSPLPTHPEFLTKLQSHPMIVQRGEDVLRTPSPASSIEFVVHANAKPGGSTPVPFPLSSGFTSPVLCASPHPLRSVSGSGSSQSSLRSLPSRESSPARTPDSATALSSPMPLRNMPFPPPPPPPLPEMLQRPQLPPRAQTSQPTAKPQLHLQPLHLPQPQPQLQTQPVPRPQPQSQIRSAPRPQPQPQPQPQPAAHSASQPELPQLQPQPQTQSRNLAPRHAGPGPRPRLPALRGSTSSVALASAPRQPSTESNCRRHGIFYMQEGMIVLKVEGSLYRVHRYLLEHHSDFFRGFITDDRDSMGHSDDRPISMPENVTQQAFDCLLAFLYSGIYDPTSVSLPDWVTLLRISTLLQFTKIRQYAIRELTARRTSLPPIDVLILAKEFDIPSWLGLAYSELVRRSSPLAEDEAERLGARTAAQVARAREMLRADEFSMHQQRRFGAQYVPADHPDEQLVVHAVNEVFKLAVGAPDAP